MNAPNPSDILLFGSPNVGKSSLFNQLTGDYVIISNYPGTTVETAQGKCNGFNLIDTPGLYSLYSISGEEKVSLDSLSNPNIKGLVHVVDAKNLERMLPFTMELMETGFPVALILNMSDELEQHKIVIDKDNLSELLGIPVFFSDCIKGEGIQQIKDMLKGRWECNPRLLRYSVAIEKRIEEADSVYSEEGKVALLSHRSQILVELFESKQMLDDPDDPEKSVLFYFQVQKERHEWSQKLTQQCFRAPSDTPGITSKLDAALLHPVWGFGIVFLILYFGLYQFVGVFGAGTVVDYFQNTVFQKNINPAIIKVAARVLPFPHLPVFTKAEDGEAHGALTGKYLIPDGREFTFKESFNKAVFDLFVGEYGIMTMAITYALALILPIVFFFFIFFSALEDSGYFPRLSFLIDRIFKQFGLNGRAVIPLILGFGCVTMATVVTRILETKRERMLAVLLMALAIPCSAQMGAFAAVLSSRGSSVFWAWVASVVILFVLVGKLAATVLPGESAVFYIELPPLRVPGWRNVWVKTKTRMIWYFIEVMPLFIWASVFIWLGQLVGIWDYLVYLISFVVEWIGISGPEKIKGIAETVIFGFFRRDYSAAHLYDLQVGGDATLLLKPLELLTISVVLTLFLPCIAQFLIMIKEFGARLAFACAGIIFFLAITAGFLVNRIFGYLGWFA